MNPMPALTTDVVVIGLGAWGSQALWRLASRGVDVVGIERFGIGHHMGSTHGATRLFRVACMEHPGLASVAGKARDLWYELGERVGESLLRQTGGLMVGPREGHVVEGTLAAARASGLEVEVIEHDDLVRRYPAYSGFGPDDIGVWDPAAGVTYPEKGVRAAVQAATTQGARVLADTRVTGIAYDSDGVTVTAGPLTVRAKHVILTAGPWMPHFVERHLVTRRTPMFWFEGSEEADTQPEGQFDLESFPVFIRELPGGKSLWGHGARKANGEDYAVKIGMEDLGYNFSDADADNVDRYIHPAGDYGELSELVAQAFPGLVNTPSKAIPCMVTNSLDRQFLVGRTQEQPRLIIGAGDSGHGFKHAPAIGELLAQIAVGEEPFTDIAFMDPNRELDANNSWHPRDHVVAPA